MVNGAVLGQTVTSFCQDTFVFPTALCVLTYVRGLWWDFNRPNFNTYANILLLFQFLEKATTPHLLPKQVCNVFCSLESKAGLNSGIIFNTVREKF